MTSTHSTIQFRTSNRLFAYSARISCAFLAAVVLIPMSASSSSGAGTTAVAAATNDPIAMAAASALDLLRGGTGNAGVRSPGTVVDSLLGAPATPSAAPSIQSSVFTSLPDSAPSSPSTASSPSAPSTPSTLPPASPGTSPGMPGTTALTGNWVSLPQKSAAAPDGPSQFANAAPVSLLPTSADVTVPVSIVPSSANAPTASPNTSVPTTKKASTKKTVTTVGAVVVEAAVPQAASGSAYDSARRTLAGLVAGRLQKLSVDQVDLAWASAEPRRMMALYAALAQVGTNYRYTGNEPGGFDCSGLTSYAWAVAGVKIPRTSTDQINAAIPRSENQLLPGDLVWRPGHIMMYLGVGDFAIDSPQTGKQVRVRQWGRTSRFGSPI